jgi:hypothetical protein
VKKVVVTIRVTRRCTVEPVQPLVATRDQHVVRAAGGVLFEREQGRPAIAIQCVSFLGEQPAEHAPRVFDRQVLGCVRCRKTPRVNDLGSMCIYQLNRFTGTQPNCGRRTTVNFN